MLKKKEFVTFCYFCEKWRKKNLHLFPKQINIISFREREKKIF